MRFAALFVAAAFAATSVSAQDATPTVPQTVDQTKPDSVKAYFTSVLNDFKSVEAQVITLLPSDKVGQVKTLLESALKLAEARVATATASADLADIASAVATIDASNKKAAADPKALASSLVANLDKDIKSVSSVLSSISKDNAAMSDVSVSAARLAAGVVAGTAVFAALF